jgi:hypothetical protein
VKRLTNSDTTNAFWQDAAERDEGCLSSAHEEGVGKQAIDKKGVWFTKTDHLSLIGMAQIDPPSCRLRGTEFKFC